MLNNNCNHFVCFAWTTVIAISFVFKSVALLFNILSSFSSTWLPWSFGARNSRIFMGIQRQTSQAENVWKLCHKNWVDVRHFFLFRGILCERKWIFVSFHSSLKSMSITLLTLLSQSLTQHHQPDHRCRRRHTNKDQGMMTDGFIVFQHRMRSILDTWEKTTHIERPLTPWLALRNLIDV